jgi:hypothetical protein
LSTQCIGFAPRVDKTRGGVHSVVRLHHPAAEMRNAA